MKWLVRNDVELNVQRVRISGIQRCSHDCIAHLFRLHRSAKVTVPSYVMIFTFSTVTDCDLSATTALRVAAVAAASDSLMPWSSGIVSSPLSRLFWAVFSVAGWAVVCGGALRILAALWEVIITTAPASDDHHDEYGSEGAHAIVVR